MRAISMKDVVSRELCREKADGCLAILTRIFNSTNLRVVFLFRLACYLKSRKVRVIPEIIKRHLARRYGCYLSLNALIDLGLRLPHPHGIVIGENVKIGKDCTIYHQVTLGGRDIGDAGRGDYPKVGDSVTIFAGAKLIGPIRIGDCSKIGANSVVNRDVPPYSVVGGVPARVLKTINPLASEVSCE